MVCGSELEYRFYWVGEQEECLLGEEEECLKVDRPTYTEQCSAVQETVCTPARPPPTPAQYYQVRDSLTSHPLLNFVSLPAACAGAIPAAGPGLQAGPPQGLHQGGAQQPSHRVQQGEAEW